MDTTPADETILKTDALGRVKIPAVRREQLLDEFERSGLTRQKFAELYVALEPKKTLPLLVNTVNPPSGYPLVFAVIKSNLPSPLTSAATTQGGVWPTLYTALEPKSPLPSLVSTVSVLFLESGQTNSTLPPLFRSAAMTEDGPVPTAMVLLTKARPCPSTESTTLIRPQTTIAADSKAFI